MKKLLIFSVVLLGLFMSSFADDNKKKDPMEYNDEIVGYYNQLDQQLVDVINAIYDSTKTVEDLQKEYDYAKAVVELNLPKLKKIKKLKNDHGFLDATIDFYETAKELLDTKYKEIMDIYNSPTAWSDEKGTRVDNLANEILDVLQEKEADVVDTQQKFAKEYDITLG